VKAIKKEMKIQRNLVKRNSYMAKTDGLTDHD